MLQKGLQIKLFSLLLRSALQEAIILKIKIKKKKKIKQRLVLRIKAEIQLQSLKTT